jgi:protein-tyrosine phosphatase
MDKFSAASDRELIVFGSARPDYEKVEAWIEFMRSHQIQRVCCLLDRQHLGQYGDLLATYRREFGTDRVCWSAIEDFQLATLAQLRQEILPFLAIADQQQEKVVVHCAGGIGRTGQVLAAWLVAGRGFSRREAIAMVKQTGRNPNEAVIAAIFQGRNPWKVAAELRALLEGVASKTALTDD